MIIAPIAAVIIQMAISRANEFQADATAAQIIGSPRGLMSALERLESLAGRVPMDVNPAAAQLAIVNPLRGRWGHGQAVPNASAHFRAHRRPPPGADWLKAPTRLGRS